MRRRLPRPARRPISLARWISDSYQRRGAFPLVLGGTGPETITAGAGGVVFSVNTDNNAVVNGSGPATIFGGPGTSVTLAGGSSTVTDFLIAAAGNETLNAASSSANDFFAMGSGTPSLSSAVMVGGAGNDTMISGAGPGSSTMTGGAGSNVFAFFHQTVGPGGLTDVVTDFTSTDSVIIAGYSSTSSAASLLANAVVAGGNVTLKLSDNTLITFSNTTTTALTNKITYSSWLRRLSACWFIYAIWAPLSLQRGAQKLWELTAWVAP